MFAVAVWRPGERELWLIRDRLGKKPLYYAFTRDGALRFASEVGPLLVDDRVGTSTTLDRIAEYFAARVRQRAAHRVSVRPRGLRPGPGCARIEGASIRTVVEPYWEPPPLETHGRVRTPNGSSSSKPS
jgi:asparagine synthase (glutamine-hydrolysing)